MLRFVKLDDPVMVEKTFTRDGKDVKIKMLDRERRFMQRLGNKFFYYREYGSTRNVHKITGAWEDGKAPMKPEDRGTKLIIFGINPDIRTPYFVPRWINQLPSVIGSRKAEEQNLEFFDAGGLPPAIIFIQGGTLAGTAAEQLKTYLSGKNKNKNRAVVVEAQSASGSLESAGQVKVTVERFGASQVNDSMYEKYDKNAEEHVRIGFRLPALFLGRTNDYNYATAVVAYMVAEEQVFQPERGEFDEVINKTILRALGAKTARFKSKGITLKNVDAQLKALDSVKDISEGKGLIDEVNKVVGLSLEYKEPEDPAVLAGRTAEAVNAAAPKPVAGKPELATTNGKAVPSSGAGTPASSAGKTPKKASELIDLAMSYGQMRGLLSASGDMSEAEKQEVVERVAELRDDDRVAFNSIVSSYVFGGADADLMSLVDNAHTH
jgi:capsid portal protein